METQEAEFRALYAKYIAWKESQQNQTDGYVYEKSFVDFVQEFNKELFELSLQNKEEEVSRKKKVQTSLGEIVVGSRHCLAPAGKKGFRQSAYLQELGCYLGQLLPFDEGSVVMEKFKGISLTDKQIERLTHHYGQVLESLPEEGMLPEACDGERHYAMMDGSMVFIRQQGWKEIKLGRIFPESACYQEKKRGCIAQSTYVAHLGEHQAFLEKFDSQVAHKKQLVAIGDGARWIWEYWNTYYPEAIQILDYFHLMEKIGLWAVLVFKEESQRKDWLALCEKLLLNNEAAEVELMIKSIDCQADRKKKQDQLLTYLQNNKDRINYKDYLEQGLFIGSGAMESANREVVQKRMKLSGQRWTLEGAQQVANLRVTFKNRHWDILIDQIKIAA
jgi:hypothetical protein